jgi:hypothetical protein
MPTHGPVLIRYADGLAEPLVSENHLTTLPRLALDRGQKEMMSTIPFSVAMGDPYHGSLNAQPQVELDFEFRMPALMIEEKSFQ